ncbi:BA14K family protein [Aureimonas sp. AU22]|uniref:BA14K family protein n=1 Tax=Aureimonas sp. AU22 TaxID=1638162 RepID=UPI000784BDCE|nr:BA14K family protein [Aureimonas sp. AU22]
MRKTLLALVTSAVAFTAAVPAAQADPWRHRDRSNTGDVLLGGAVGLAAGALLGSALSQPRQPEYYAPAPGYYEPPPRPVYVAPPSYEDTIPAPPRYYQPRQARYYDDYGTYTRGGGSHVERCLARYRSYDPRSDTYVGYDGYERRCNL